MNRNFPGTLQFAVVLGSAALCLTLCPGCSSTGAIFREPSRLLHDPGQLVGRPKVEKTVIRIVSLWEAASGKDPSDKPARGFAGQILFFGPNGETGARVRGRVVIYEYDNYDPDSGEEPEPLHSFTFEPDAWDIHRAEGTLGHSYSCFIPYMSPSRERANCGLKVEFTGDDGRRVCSETVEVMLPSRSGAANGLLSTRGFVREAQLGTNPVIQRSRSGEIPQVKQQTLDSISIPFPKQ
jgi:hypothetical protein